MIGDPPLTLASPTMRQRAARGVECPACGRDWAPACPRATGPTWDPTIGVRSTDPDRHRSVVYRTGGIE